MFKESMRKHGLETFIGRQPKKISQPQVEILIQSNLGHINLRGKIENSPFLKKVEDLLGQKIPIESNTSSINKHRIYWLSPNEWLILTSVNATANLVENLQHMLATTHASVNDISGGQVALRITGSPVRDMLAKGCPVDFHPKVFNEGMCTQSALARTNVLIGMVQAPHTFDVIVRRSFSDYLLHWLKEAAAEYTTEWMEK